MQSLMLLFINRYCARVTNLLLVPSVALKTGSACLIEPSW